MDNEKDIDVRSVYDSIPEEDRKTLHVIVGCILDAKSKMRLAMKEMADLQLKLNADQRAVTQAIVENAMDKEEKND